MAIRINFDAAHNPEAPTLILAKKNGDKLGLLNSKSVQLTGNLQNASEISFIINKFVDGKITNLWDEITDFKLIYCVEWDVWFEISVQLDESTEITKTVFCTSLGHAELSQIMIFNVEINTENDIAREDYKIPTIFYNIEHPEASLIHRILEKAPHYTIAHVDDSIKNIQRTFTFDNISIYDAFQEIAQEIHCLFIFNSNSDRNGEIQRIISVYDLESNCLDCGYRGEFTRICPKCGKTNIYEGYGKDTGIFISSDELADNIQFTTNVGAIKNCFKLEAGDDLMTATIRNSNPNGTDYIWYISDSIKLDMSKELVTKLNDYDKLYEYYQKEYSSVLNAERLKSYNNLIDKYKTYNKSLEKIVSPIIGYSTLIKSYYNTIDFYGYLQSSMLPQLKKIDTDAAKEVNKLTSSNIGSVAVNDVSKVSQATTNNAVLAIAKLLIDTRYKVQINSSSYNSVTKIWSGDFTVTNYTDDNDTARSSYIYINIVDDYKIFVEQKIEKALSKVNKEDISISGLFEKSSVEFAQGLKEYCLDSLQAVLNACQSCLDILIEQGIGNKDFWEGKNPNLYNELYLDYFNRLNIIKSEIKLRQNEIGIIIGSYDESGNLKTNGLQTDIENIKLEIQDKLNFEKYLGKDLWLEFCTFRREDKYSNTNYISDGVSTSELFDKADEFIKEAKKEIYKSSVLQHSISSTLKNLLTIKSFQNLVNDFQVGNWLRVMVNNEVYKLRLISYTIDYDDLCNLSVEFSDVIKDSTSVKSIQDILNESQSMSSSYSSVKHQAQKGESSKSQLDYWVNKGLALTQMKIVDNADNQNITFDSHGLLCREYLPITDSYDNQQLKIINRGLYLTNDNWTTSRAGIGNFAFYNPMTGKMEEAYGVIADTLVGNLILSEKVGVYSKDNSIVLGENGLVITTNKKDSDTINKLLFLIQKNTIDSYGQSTNQKLVYIDDYGNLVLNGSIKINASTNSNIGSLDDLSDDSRFDGVINGAITDAIKPFEEKFASMDIDINGIRGEIGTVTQNFTGKIDGINGTINVINGQITGINGDINSINGSLDRVNSSIGDINGSLNGIHGDISGINNEIVKLTEKLDLKLSSDEVELKISQSITAGTKPLYDSIAALSGNATSLKAYVEETKRELQSGINGKESDIAALKQKVEATMTSQEIQLAISNSLQNGVSKVETTTGFVFNEDGLTVSKTGQEMTTRITENGMIITQNQSEVLTANNIGVDAKNLHATTYLIVGNNSRFEDYKTNRTGCFYIGA